VEDTLAFTRKDIPLLDDWNCIKMEGKIGLEITGADATKDCYPSFPFPLRCGEKKASGALVGRFVGGKIPSSDFRYACLLFYSPFTPMFLFDCCGPAVPIFARSVGKSGWKVLLES
jgi:hypothetical protein